MSRAVKLSICPLLGKLVVLNQMLQVVLKVASRQRFTAWEASRTSVSR